LTNGAGGLKMAKALLRLAQDSLEIMTRPVLPQRERGEDEWAEDE